MPDNLFALFAQANAARAAGGNAEDYADAMQEARLQYLEALKTYDPTEGPLDTWAALRMVGARDEKRDQAREGVDSLDRLAEYDHEPTYAYELDQDGNLIDNNGDDSAVDRVMSILLEFGHMSVADVLKLHGQAPHGLDSAMLAMSLSELFKHFQSETPAIMPTYSAPAQPKALDGQAFAIYADEETDEPVDDESHPDRVASWMPADEDENAPDDYSLKSFITGYPREKRFTGQPTFEEAINSNNARIQVLTEWLEFADDDVRQEELDAWAEERAELMSWYPVVQQVNQAGGRHTLDDGTVYAHTIIHADGRVEITSRATEKVPFEFYPEGADLILPMEPTPPAPEYAYVLRLGTKNHVSDNIKAEQGGWTRFQTNRIYTDWLWALPLSHQRILLAASHDVTNVLRSRWQIDLVHATKARVCNRTIDGRPATRITLAKVKHVSNVQIDYRGPKVESEGPYFPTSEDEDTEEWEGMEPLFELPEAQVLAVGLKAALDGLADLPGKYIFTAAYRRAYLVALLDGKGEGDAKRAGWLAWLKAQVVPNMEKIVVRGMLPDKKVLVAVQPDGSTYNVPIHQAIAQFFRLVPAPGIEHVQMVTAMTEKLGKDGQRLASRVNDYAELVAA